MNKKIFLLFLCLYTLTGIANDNDSTKNTIGIYPILMPINEVGIYYEHRLKTHISIGIGANKIYRNKVFYWIPVGAIGSPALYYDGLTATLIFKKDKNFDYPSPTNSYRGFLITYKYKQFEDIWLWQGGFGGSDFSYSLLLSKYKTTILAQYIFGRRKEMKRILIDYYLGTGIRMFISKTNYFEKKYLQASHSLQDYEPHSERLILPLPAITFNILIGLKW